MYVGLQPCEYSSHDLHKVLSFRVRPKTVYPIVTRRIMASLTGSSCCSSWCLPQFCLPELVTFFDDRFLRIYALSFVKFTVFHLLFYSHEHHMFIYIYLYIFTHTYIYIWVYYMQLHITQAQVIKLWKDTLASAIASIILQCDDLLRVIQVLQTIPFQVLQTIPSCRSKCS